MPPVPKDYNCRGSYFQFVGKFHLQKCHSGLKKRQKRLWRQKLNILRCVSWWPQKLSWKKMSCTSQKIINVRQLLNRIQLFDNWDVPPGNKSGIFILASDLFCPLDTHDNSRRFIYVLGHTRRKAQKVCSSSDHVCSMLYFLSCISGFFSWHLLVFCLGSVWFIQSIQKWWLVIYVCLCSMQDIFCPIQNFHNAKLNFFF